MSLGNAALEVAAGQTAPLSVAVADVQDLYGSRSTCVLTQRSFRWQMPIQAKDGIQVAAGDFLSADFVAQNQANNQVGSIRLRGDAGQS